MATNHEFYLARAQDARADADGATLANVRDRALRSEAAWLVMARRAQLGDDNREKIRLARIEAAPAPAIDA